MVIKMAHFIMFLCRGCQAPSIASRANKTRKCPKCNRRNELARVIVKREFDTWEEASDYLRLIKIPPGDRARAAEGEIPYQSSNWSPMKLFENTDAWFSTFIYQDTKENKRRELEFKERIQ